MVLQDYKKHFKQNLLLKEVLKWIKNLMKRLFSATSSPRSGLIKVLLVGPAPGNIN